MKPEEKEGLETLKPDDIIKVYFKKGFGRPTDGQRFKFITLGGNPDYMDKKDGYYVDGFIIVAEAIDLDGKELMKEGKAIPQALFPHTIEKIETED